MSDEYLLQVEAVGQWYRSYLDELTGIGRMQPTLLHMLPAAVQKRLELFIFTIEQYRNEQEKQLQPKKKTAEKLLTQIFTQSRYQESLKDESQYHLVQLSRGVCAVYMKNELYQQFAQQHCFLYVGMTHWEKATAFILLKEQREDQVKKQLLHEMHHIVWNVVHTAGLVTISEKHPQAQQAFRVFQDEMLARLSAGDRRFVSSTHFHQMEKSEFIQFKQQESSCLEDIERSVFGINTYIDREIVPFLQRHDISSQIFLYPIMKAENFDELQKNIQYIYTAVQKNIKE